MPLLYPSCMRNEGEFEPIRGMRERMDKDVFEELPVMIWSASSRGIPEFFNQKAAAFLGLSEQSIKKSHADRNAGVQSVSSWRQWIHPDDLERSISQVKESLAAGEAYNLECRLLRVDGVFRWVQCIGEPIIDEHGEMVRWHGIMIDVDERKKAEQALRESEARFRAILDTIPAFIWGVSPQGEPVVFNKRMVEFTGISEEEMKRRGNCHDLHPDDVERASDDRRRSLLAGAPFRGEYRMRRFDGAYRWISCMGEPQRDDAGAVVCWYGVDVDIDDNKRQERQLQTAQRSLEQASQIAMIAELSASISHELNQPLTAVLSNGQACANWLSAEPPNLERARRAADDIVRDGSKAAEIVRKVKALFQRASANKSLLDIRELVSETLLLHTDRIGRAAVSVRTEFAPTLLDLYADRIQIQQVISNLILNAIEAMEFAPSSRKVLSISVRRSGTDATCIELEDTGCGIEDSSKVFDPFFTTKLTGIGVGLSVCKSIVESHGGQISLRSNIATGTVFSITLPTA